MYIKRVVVRNFRNLKNIDIQLDSGLTCLVGENNSGKSNLLTALRLVLDTNYPNYYRKLCKEDFTAGIDISTTQQILIAAQFTDFDSTDDENKIKEHALAQICGIEDNIAQICYRFRPRQVVRQEIESEERSGSDLTIEDYEWELVGGAVPNSDGNIKDLMNVEWQDEFTGGHVKFNSLEAFRIAFLPAIRDVEEDLRRISTSPLHKILEIQDISEDRKDELINKIKRVNEEIISEPEIVSLKKDVDSGFNKTVGSAFSMNVSLGMADATFIGLSRSLRMLLSGSGLNEADISRNGLGINNALYISMLLKYYEKLIEKENTAGELLLIEEPEAHLHPQLQNIIFSSLIDKKSQIVATTHSTHITSHASLDNLIILTPEGNEVTAKRPTVGEQLSPSEREDLERYLDATKSLLLFAKRVILVEGMSEVFLIPKLVKQVMGIDLEKLGISVVPVHGIHFDAYLKLFGPDVIRKKCLVLTDGDLKPSDAKEISDDEIDDDYEFPRVEDLKQYENEFVKIENCKTTFERAIAMHGNLKMFSGAASELGAPRNSKILLGMSEKDKLEKDEQINARDKVLNTAIKFGKARFAQVASKYSSIVYCKDVNRTEDYSRISFDFLGYTFRPRRCVNPKGQVHTNFLPAISRDSIKEINRRIRNWRIQLKNEKALLDFSRIFNPILRGWYAYYGRFYPSALGRIWNNINRYLVRWVCRKFKRFFRHKKRARRFLDRYARAHPDLFIHWRLGVFP